jgi:hypothetical protein
MAVSAKMFANAPLNAYKKLVSDLSAGGTHIYCALLTSAAAPTQETMDTWANVKSTCTEVVGTGYTQNGVELTTKTLAEATRVTTFDADDASWAASTITARYAVVYDRTAGTDAGKVLMFVDFGADVSTTNGTFTIQWSASGLFTDTVAA